MLLLPRTQIAGKLGPIDTVIGEVSHIIKWTEMQLANRRHLLTLPELREPFIW